MLLSGSVLKNAYAVTVPNTGGRRGIAAAVMAGVLSGKPELELQLLDGLGEDDWSLLAGLLEKTPVSIQQLRSPHSLHIVAKAMAGTDSAMVEIIGGHTDVCRVEKNQEVLLEKLPSTNVGDEDDRSLLQCAQHPFLCGAGELGASTGYPAAAGGA